MADTQVAGRGPEYRSGENAAGLMATPRTQQANRAYLTEDNSSDSPSTSGEPSPNNPGAVGSVADLTASPQLPGFMTTAAAFPGQLPPSLGGLGMSMEDMMRNMQRMQQQLLQQQQRLMMPATPPQLLSQKDVLKNMMTSSLNHRDLANAVSNAVNSAQTTASQSAKRSVSPMLFPQNDGQPVLKRDRHDSTPSPPPPLMMPPTTPERAASPPLPAPTAAAPITPNGAGSTPGGALPGIGSLVGNAAGMSPLPSMVSPSNPPLPTTPDLAMSMQAMWGPSSAVAHALALTSQQRRPRSEKKSIPEDLKDNKYYERRKRNNSAAKKSRDARKAREDEIAIRASFLEKENAILRAQVATLREEANSLRQLMLQKRSGRH